MEIKIVEGPNGAKTMTTRELFHVLWKTIVVLHEEERDFYDLPQKVRIEGGERRDTGLLASFGYKVEIEAIVA